MTLAATPPPVVAAPAESGTPTAGRPGLRRRQSGQPWNRPRVLTSITWLYVAWSLVPVLIAIVFSFNRGRSRSSWQGFSIRWWWTDGGSLRHDPALLLAVRNSLILGLVTIVIVVPLGMALAIGLTRWRRKAASGANVIALLPLVTPEIVMGAALFIVFKELYTGIPLGRPAQILGHVTFTLSFVVVIVRGRLIAIGPVYEEAARDLGANARQALRLIILPLLWPAVFASAVIVFATSLDDFVIASFLSSGAGTETVPIRIYGSARGGATPALNAVATLMLLVTLGVIALGLFVLSQARKRRGGQGEANALGDLAGMSV
jgi:spermidine/putrescine transport system permease protein